MIDTINPKPIINEIRKGFTNNSKAKVLLEIKKGIWLYFFLLIFEGALRKWIVPSLSSVILLIRDPLVLIVFYKAIKSGLFKINFYIYSVLIISLISFVITIYFGHGNLLVALFGLRILAIQFPFIFIIGFFFSKNDVIALGKYLIYINIGMTILVALQYFSPQTAWVNKGIGDAESSGFTGSGGYFRVPGTFSFTNGLSFFYGFVTAYIFYFWMENKHLNKVILSVSTFCLLVAIPLTISRWVLLEFLISLFSLLLISGRNPKVIGRIIITLLLISFVFFVLSSLPFFIQLTDIFMDRFNSANEQEGGAQTVFMDRILGGMLGALYNNKIPFWGLGLGMGTNAGSAFLTGTVTYLISEGEWGRIIGEMGLLLGFFIIILKVSLVFLMCYQSWKNIGLNNVLPWLLFSFAFLMLLNGQWGQPTSLGFSVLSGGLVLSAQNKTT